MSPYVAPALLNQSTDISTSEPGFTQHAPSSDTYTIGGNGADLWGAADHFRFTWARLSGDAILSAKVHIDGPTTHPLAKALLMFRQSLEPGAPYADIALHADGHITLQYRLVLNGETKDVTLPGHNLQYLQIRREGSTFTVTASATGPGLQGKSASVTFPLESPAYVGLGVCSHNIDTFQVVTFSEVRLIQPR